MNKEFYKMQKLAGIITEGQYKQKLNENSGIDWNDYEGYETLLDEFFDDYNLEDPQEFKDNIINGGSDAANNLGWEIAQRAGFTGDIDEYTDDKNLNLQIYFTQLAETFICQFAIDMGVINKNDPDYIKNKQKNDKFLRELEPKILQQYPL